MTKKLTEFEKDCIEVLLKTVMVYGKGNCNRTFMMYANRILEKYEENFRENDSKKEPTNYFLKSHNIEYKNVKPAEVLIQTIEVYINEFYEDFLNDEDFKKFCKYMEKYNKMSKYKLGDKKIFLIEKKEKPLYRVIAEKDFQVTTKNGSVCIRKGELGGFIESEQNLSQTDSSWIIDLSAICGTSQISNSFIYSSCTIKDCIIKNSFIKNSKLKDSNIENSKITSNVIFNSFVTNCNIEKSRIENIDSYDSTLYACQFNNGVFVDNSLLIGKKYDGIIKFKDIKSKN